MKKGQKTRESLIRAAAKLARVKGFDRTSVQEVMDEAGVGKGSFYHHFKSKDALGLAVLERERASFMEMLDACFNEKKGLEALECFFRVSLEVHSGKGLTGGCLWGNTALEMSDNNQAYVEPVDEVFREWTGKLQQAIREAQAGGLIRGDLPDYSLALLLVAAIEGGIMMSRLRKDETPLRSCLDLLGKLLRPAREPGSGERMNPPSNRNGWNA